MNSDLSLDELGWLLGLASARRKSREQSLERIRRRPGQSETEYQDGRSKIERSLAWSRSVEDRLIVLVGDADPMRLRAPQRDRYEKLQAIASTDQTIRATEARTSENNDPAAKPPPTPVKPAEPTYVVPR